METIKIYSSKRKALYILLLSLLFLPPSILMIFNAENATNPILRNPFFVQFFGVIGVLLSILGSLVALKRLYKKQLMLMLTVDGILINPTKNKIIKWSDVIYSDEDKINNVKIICIYVSNPQWYIDAENKKIRKKTLQFNYKNYGTPFCISATSLDMKSNELLEVLSENQVYYNLK